MSRNAAIKERKDLPRERRNGLTKTVQSGKVVELLKTNLLLNVHLYLITEYTRITRLNTTCTKNTKTHPSMRTITADFLRHFRHTS